MYRKQRLTPKLRKKQKIVVSTPRNLWYDTGNNPARKGKTADMEKNEMSGAVIAPLFQLSRDAVCGAAQGRIVFANPAACRLFGADITGERVETRFPGLEENICGDNSFAASVTVDGTPRSVTAARCGELLVLTVRTEEPPFPPVPPTALRQMRTAAFNLRMALDCLAEDEPENRDNGGEMYSSILFHSYYSMLHVINQLSDVNALAAGTMACRMQPLSIRRLVSDLLGSAEFFLRRKHIAFRWEILGENLFVEGDRDRLEQLLLILIANSVMHTGEGGTITVRLKRHGRLCRLTLCDDGRGMTESELAEVFTPNREDLPTNVQDSGLGLSIAQGLAQLHNGVLVIQRGKAGETSMHLQLPLTGKLPLRDTLRHDSGPELLLTELSEELPTEAYRRKYRE